MSVPSLRNCTTVSSFKSYEKNIEISYAKTFLKSVVKSDDDNLIVNYTSLPNKYYDYIKAIVKQIELSDDELIQYRYNPKLYCYRYYGTTELWSLLLKVNNMTSAIDFTKKKINVFTEEIFSILNEIFILEKENIVKNNSYINTIE